MIARSFVRFSIGLDPVLMPVLLSREVPTSNDCPKAAASPIQRLNDKWQKK